MGYLCHAELNLNLFFIRFRAHISWWVLQIGPLRDLLLCILLQSFLSILLPLSNQRYFIYPAHIEVRVDGSYALFLLILVHGADVNVQKVLYLDILLEELLVLLDYFYGNPEILSNTGGNFANSAQVVRHDGHDLLIVVFLVVVVRVEILVLVQHR